MTWDVRFLDQARSDLAAYQALVGTKLPACHQLHYLQMVCEKVGKAAFSRGEGGAQPPRTHRAFGRLLRLLARNHALTQYLGMPGAGMRTMIDRLLPLADAIETLAPDLAGPGPNAEYPWETPGGQVMAPCLHTFPLTAQLQQPSGVRLLKLIETLVREFNRFF